MHGKENFEAALSEEKSGRLVSKYVLAWFYWLASATSLHICLSLSRHSCKYQRRLKKDAGACTSTHTHLHSCPLQYYSMVLFSFEINQSIYSQFNAFMNEHSFPIQCSVHLQRTLLSTIEPHCVSSLVGPKLKF